MIEMYVKLIQTGKKKLADVPVVYLEKVENRLNEIKGAEQ